MKSLRTDDILGAKPRIRHAPKNIIRDQYIQKNPYYSYEPQTISELHMSESFHEKSPAGRPYYKAPAPYQGYLAQLNPYNNPRMDEPMERYPPHYQRQNQYRTQNAKYVLPKDAPVVDYQNRNYQHHPLKIQQQYQYQYQNNNNYPRRASEGKPSRQSNQNSRNAQNINEGLNRKDGRESEGSRRSEGKSIRENSAQNLKEKQKETSIFRGLGYNIITNHKFSYDMENTRKNETSKWLDYQ